MKSKPSVFIGLSGQNRIGKTTMLKWLTTNYEVTNCNPGEALKVMWAFSQRPLWQQAAGNWYFKHECYSKLREVMQEDAAGLLAYYEEQKAHHISLGLGQEFRHYLIGFAEMWRAFYPEIWCKLAKELFYVEGQVAFGEILNRGEYNILRRQYDYVFPIGLVCAEPAEGGGDDSRGKLSHYDNIFSYEKPYDSINIATKIVEWYNDAVDGISLQKLPLVEEKPF
jgi:hypothetical protein